MARGTLNKVTEYICVRQHNLFLTNYFPVWEKIKHQKENERFVAENDEEFEDSQGNVVNRKTYEDLKRQGLL